MKFMNNREKIKAAKKELFIYLTGLEAQMCDIEDSIERIKCNIEQLDDLDENADEQDIDNAIEDLKKW